ncbi:malonyl-ACP O-methyltransferase BioC [Halalkalibacterium halodurans]|uniref:malonyl-ACP O-methyltransferase BioC n=1 Tax=Halalkalibacterium halodurans TaxID=86665 RepID=UPI002E1DB49C|nr:malonyl-ACP O-methyltransferase BioC [Halalkalibacterium halodurans]MED4084102.1 malonyl-ACP O-methyltransferase BioC [Halalkalibacterium halodurans]MED4104580.1 malonyl-ACP O-methyltransferase BioC [Halalkalibacterium halodurans]MED4108308.1 malonyl-ACP O-methyltransferase BioC [Halalkalibacterium halodurans]MED4147329.1 malonyl-ACP O-methyltransferase BioC [Halalkalibacterium halodurans]
MFIDKQTVERHFSKSAHLYDGVNHVQRKMAHRLVQLLDEKRRDAKDEPRAILDIGCGTGWLTRECLKSFPQATIDAVDLSKQMLEVAEKNVSFHPNVQFIQGDIEKMVREKPSAKTYDVIVANAVFQWLDKPTETVGQLRSWLKPNGLLLFSTFGPDTFYELHDSFLLAAKQLRIIDERRGLDYLSKSEWKRILDGLFAELTIHEEKAIESYSTVEQFLHTVKKMGATYSQSSRPLSKRYYQLMKEIYEQRYRTEDSIPATYDCLYVLCQA